VALTLVASLLVACGGEPATSAPSREPAGAGSDASTPVAAATPTPTPSAAPAPTPTVEQLAAAYLEAAAAANRASHNAWLRWDQSAQALTDAKRLAKAYAAAELAFIRVLKKIPWYGDYRTLARRVLTYENQIYVAHRSALRSKTWVDWNDRIDKADRAALKRVRASNELRIALGLQPIPFE
jgi:hypothetical protein